MILDKKVNLENRIDQKSGKDWNIQEQSHHTYQDNHCLHFTNLS